MTSDKSSKDQAGFRSLIATDLSMKSVQWEIFGSPEYTGGLPSRTEYMTLIAEVTPSDGETYQTQAKSGKVGIVEEAARPWLAEEFRSMLAKHKDSVVALSDLDNCGKFTAKIRQSGRVVNGFICNGIGKSLIYLTLSGEFDTEH